MFCKAGLVKYSKSALKVGERQKTWPQTRWFHDFGKKAPPLSKLYLTLTKELDIPAKQFSGSTGTISQIMA
jgi:hypothetical protein